MRILAATILAVAALAAPSAQTPSSPVMVQMSYWAELGREDEVRGAPAGSRGAGEAAPAEGEGVEDDGESESDEESRWPHRHLAGGVHGRGNPPEV